MLVRLMYASRAVAPLGADGLAAILRSSRRHNPELGVTGVLCVSDGLFLQVLEGGRLAVSQLYNRIACDPRHKDVALLGFEEIGERRFAGWAMGQVDLSDINAALVLKYSETTTLDPYAVSGAVSMALFNELVATASVVCQA
ncbi:MAG: BLUF domain-containing protein [Rhizobacter sp.]|nr:BLUF domain-containing protein [Rhizobacter sp.]